MKLVSVLVCTQPDAADITDQDCMVQDLVEGNHGGNEADGGRRGGG